MTKTGRRILSMVLAVLMVISSMAVFCIPAAAATYPIVAEEVPATAQFVTDVDPQGGNVYILDSNITDAAGEYTLSWLDTVYAGFEIGVNAFSTLDAINAKVAEDGATDPSILVVSVAAGTSIIAKYPAKFFTQAYSYDNTPVHIVGTAVDGSDWTANPAFDEKSVVVKSLAVGPNVGAGTVEFHGFTLQGRILDGYRTPSASAPLTLVVNNCKFRQTESNHNPGAIDGVSLNCGTNYIFCHRNGLTHNANDVAAFTNIMIDTMHTSSRLIGESYWATTVFDNLFVDRDNTRGGPAYVKTNGPNVTNWFVVRNSNINSAINIYFEGLKEVSYSHMNLIFDNNILYQFGKNTSGILRPHLYAWNRIDLTNNTVIADSNGRAIFWGDRNGLTDFPNALDVNINGNKFLGTTSSVSMQMNVYNLYNADVDVSGNYTTTTIPTDFENITAEGVPFTVGYEKNHTPLKRIVGTDNYYYDADMSLSSKDIFLESVVADDALVSLSDSFITIDAGSMAGNPDVIYPVFTTVSGGGNVAIYDGDTVINSIDLIANGPSKTYKVVVSAKTTAGRVYSKEYTLTVITQNAESFNAIFDAAAADGTLITSLGLVPAETIVYIEGIGVGETANAHFDGSYYSFTQCEYVVGSIDEVNALIDAGAKNVIMPSGEYSATTFTKAANYLGANAGINPNVKGVNVTDDWTLNENWGAAGETGIREVIIGAGTAGEITFNGLTLRHYITDTARTIDSGKLVITFENIVVNQIASLGNRSYFFNFQNARSLGGNAEFAATYSDEVHIKNFRVESVYSSNRILAEKSAALVEFDNYYINADNYHGSGNMQQILSWFKNGQNSFYNMDVIIQNSMFRNNMNDYGRSFIEPQPQDTSDAIIYNTYIRNNVFYDYVASGNGDNYSYILSPAGRINEFVIENNTFVTFNSTIGAIAPAPTPYITDANGDGIDDNNDGSLFTVANNNFIGFKNEPSKFNLGVGDKVNFTNNFYTEDTVNYLTAACGERNIRDNSEKFWLNMDRTLSSSDLAIISATDSEVYDGSNSIVMNLKNSSFNASAFTATAGATVTIYKDGALVETVNIADIDPVGSHYTVAVSDGTYVREYDLVVYMGELKDLVDNPAVSDVALLGAYLVKSSLASVVAGSTVVEYWNGTLYKFTVGVNAFATLDEAADYYVAAGNVGTPKIVITEWSGNMDINKPMEIYAPNYDTVPFIKGTAIDGSDWTENADYMNNQVTAAYVKVERGIVGTVGVYGLSVSGNIAIKTAVHEGVTDITFKNICKVAGSTIDCLYLISCEAEGHRVDNNDVLNVINFYIKNTKEDGTYNNRIRLIGEYTPAQTTFDGLYVDGNVSGMNHAGTNANNLSYIKTAANNSCFTIKNSNLRNLNPTRFNQNGSFLFQGNNNADVDGAVRKIAFDNNILYNVYKTGGSNTFVFGWYGNAYSDVAFTNNYIEVTPSDLMYNEEGIYEAGFFHTLGPNAENSKEQYGKAIITGNTLNGVSGSLQINSDKFALPYTFTVNDNFTTGAWTNDITTAVGRKVAATNLHVTEGDVGFWLDYDRTMYSNVICDYTLAEYAVVDAEMGTINVEYVEGDGRINIEEVYEDVTTENPIVNADGTTSTETVTESVFAGYKYNIDLRDLVVDNLYGNGFYISYGETMVKPKYVLSFTVDKLLGSNFAIDLTITSPDETISEVWSVNFFDDDCGATAEYAIKDGVLTITGTGALYDATIAEDMKDTVTSIVISDGITSIGAYNFSGYTNVTEVSIPTSVTAIGDYAFDGMTSLAKVTFAGTTEQWNAVVIGTNNDAIAAAEIVCEGDPVSTIITGAAGANATYTFDTATGILTLTGTGTLWSGIPTSDANAIYREDVVEIVIESGFTAIGGNVFGNSKYPNVTKVTLPDGITSIGDSAFHECKKLREINIPEGVKSIGAWAFYACNQVVNYTFPSTLESIGDNAFYGVYSKGFNFNGTRDAWDAVTVSELGNERLAFTVCTDDTLTILPTGDTALIFNAGRETLYISGTMYTGDYAADSATHLVSDDIAANVKHIVLDKTIAGFGSYNFVNLTNLETVTGGENMRYLGIWAFKGLTKLTTVDFIGADLFGVMCYGAFADCTSLTNVKLSNSLVTLGGAAFRNCTSLTSIVVPAKIQGIGDNTFYGCTSLETVEILGAKAIRQQAFAGCTAIQTITLPDGFTTIDEWAFSGPTGGARIGTINIPASLTTVNAFAFFWANVTTVNYAGSAEDWAKINVADNNRWLTEATINFGA